MPNITPPPPPVLQVVNGSGTVHLPVTFSPEYPGPPGPDANYDLALYRWGLQLAADLMARYGLTSPHAAAWQATLANLTGYSVDPASNTYEIYAGVPYGTPHRHYSHLFAVYPLRDTPLQQPYWAQLARDSVNRWLATPEMDSQFYRCVTTGGGEWTASCTSA
jgi:alpha-L-fucosidase 2